MPVLFLHKINIFFTLSMHLTEEPFFCRKSGASAVKKCCKSGATTETFDPTFLYTHPLRRKYQTNNQTNTSNPNPHPRITQSTPECTNIILAYITNTKSIIAKVRVSTNIVYEIKKCLVKSGKVNPYHKGIMQSIYFLILITGAMVSACWDGRVTTKPPSVRVNGILP